MALCRRGRVDLILTKSVSRFARNTVDCLKYVRLLRAKGVGILFEKENINTLELSGELMLTFYGGFAQAESESISTNVAIGQRMGMKAGKVVFQYKWLYGYKKSDNGTPEIIPEEAAIVRRIYYSMLAGHSAKRIADSLKAENVPPPSFAEEWSSSIIQRILKNEIYAGDSLRQKTYVADCISKTVRKNTGELPQYYIMDNHPAIVPREIFNRVQEEFARRNSKTALSTTSSKTNKGRFSSKYALSELIRCSECGAAYRRVTWPAKEQGGQKRIVWRCVSRLEHGKETCKTAPTIPESALHTAIMEAIRLLKLDTEDAKADVREVLAETIQRPNGETVQNIDALIEQQRDELIKLLTQNPDANEPENMDNAKFTMMLNSMEVLQSRKETLLRRTQADENAEHRMSEIMDTLQSGELDISEYDDTLVRKLVESVTVISDKLTVIFRNGTEVRITWK